MPSLEIRLIKAQSEVEKHLGTDLETKAEILATLAEATTFLSTKPSRRIADLERQLFNLQLQILRDTVADVKFKDYLLSKKNPVADLSIYGTDFFTELESDAKRYLYAKVLLEVADQRQQVPMNLWSQVVSDEGRMQATELYDDEDDTDAPSSDG